MRKIDLPIANPCLKRWAELEGDRVRYCGSCGKLVLHLSAFGRAEAELLLQAEPLDGRCVRYSFDAEGQIRFADDPDPPRPHEDLILLDEELVPEPQVEQREESTMGAIDIPAPPRETPAPEPWPPRGWEPEPEPEPVVTETLFAQFIEPVLPAGPQPEDGGVAAGGAGEVVVRADGDLDSASPRRGSG